MDGRLARQGLFRSCSSKTIPSIARAIGIAIGIAGHRLELTSGPEEGLSRLASCRYDAILLDMNFSAGADNGEEGLACLRRIMAGNPEACVIVITAHSGIRIAVASMQEGARNFLMKPWRNADLVAKLENAIARCRVVAHGTRTPSPSADPPAVLIGESMPMQELRGMISRVGPTSAGVAVKVVNAIS